MSYVRTSLEFQAGYDAATKAKQVLLDAVEQEIVRLQLLLSLAKHEIELLRLGRSFKQESKFLEALRAYEGGTVCGETTTPVVGSLEIGDCGPIGSSTAQS